MDGACAVEANSECSNPAVRVAVEGVMPSVNTRLPSGGCTCAAYMMAHVARAPTGSATPASSCPATVPTVPTQEKRLGYQDTRPRKARA